jgi:hypothetical protein
LRALPYHRTTCRAVLASVFLKERLGRLGICGCALCLIGSLVIIMRESLAEAKSRRDPKSDRTSLSVADAPADPEIETIDQIWNYAVQPSEWTPTASLVFLDPSALTWFSSLVIAFLFYLAFVTFFSLFMIYRVMPTHGKKNPVVYLSVCSVVGSISVMAIKVRAGRATESKPLRGLAGLIHYLSFSGPRCRNQAHLRGRQPVHPPDDVPLRRRRRRLHHGPVRHVSCPS